MRFCHASACLIGAGLLSMKMSLNSEYQWKCSRFASSNRPAFAAATSAPTSAGMMFDATLITPHAPALMNGSVSESSPDKISNASGSAARNALTRSTVPPASLMATMFAQSFASRTHVSTAISTPQRPGMLYKMIGSFVFSAMARKWR